MSSILPPPAPAYNPSPRPAFVPNEGRARVVVVLLIINAALSLLSAGTSALGLAYPVRADEEIADPITLVVALLQLGVGALQLVVFIATVVAFCLWLYRAYENLPAFGHARSEIKYSSGWAVGSFFVPIVLLVVPYRAMKELWVKSVPNIGKMFADLSPPAIFPLWWAVWLISGFANQLLFRLELQDAIDPKTSYMLGILLGLFDVLTSAAAIAVVREIQARQNESSKLVAPEDRSVPPPMPPTFEPPLQTQPT